MARPTKQGIDYFPLDVVMDDDLQLFIAENGADALAILITVWQIIYQNEGYYAVYDNKFPAKVKQRILVDVERVDLIVNKAVEWEIFDKGIFEKHKILTSKGIQKRYLVAARLKKTIRIYTDLLLVDVSNVGNVINIVGNPFNSVGNATNVNVKVNVKGKEEREEEKEPAPSKIPIPVSTDEHKNLDESMNLWRMIFLSNPGLVERDFTSDLIEKFGFKKAKMILYELREKNFKAVSTMKSAVDVQGNIKPREENERNGRVDRSSINDSWDDYPKAVNSGFNIS